jgi:hypothetical protein
MGVGVKGVAMLSVSLDDLFAQRAPKGNCVTQWRAVLFGSAQGGQ